MRTALWGYGAGELNGVLLPGRGTGEGRASTGQRQREGHRRGMNRSSGRFYDTSQGAPVVMRTPATDAVSVQLTR